MKTRSMILGLLAIGAAVSFMPTPAKAADGYCREYTRTVYIGNRQEVVYGTACYQPNGDWKIVDEDDRSRIGQRFRNEDIEARYQPIYQPVYQPVSRSYYYRTMPQRTSVVFISDNHRYYPPGHYKRYDRHDRRHDNRHDRRSDRDHDRRH